MYSYVNRVFRMLFVCLRLLVACYSYVSTFKSNVTLSTRLVFSSRDLFDAQDPTTVHHVHIEQILAQLTKHKLTLIVTNRKFNANPTSKKDKRRPTYWRLGHLKANTTGVSRIVFFS